MKVRFLLGDASGGGGAIRTTLNLAGALADRGHEVEVVSVICRWRRRAYPLSRKVRLRLLTAPRKPLRDGWYRPRWLAGRIVRAVLERFHSRLIPPTDKLYRQVSLWTDLKLWQYVRRQQGGVLVGTNPALNFVVARLASSDLVTVGEEHLNLAVRRPGVRPSLQKWYRRLDAIVALTEGDAADYRAFLGEGVHVAAVPNAVPEITVVGPAPLMEPTVVAGGRLKPQKGFDLLVQAWQWVGAAHPDWRLRIYGRGPERRPLRALVDQLALQDQVRIEGFTPALPTEIANCSIFVLSSRYEGFPMVLLEAMACGVPVVAFNCPTGPSELVEDGINGRLVPAGSVRALADAMCQLIEDPDLRTRMGAAAQRTSSHYSREAMAARWDELLELLVNRKRKDWEPRRTSVAESTPNPAPQV